MNKKFILFLIALFILASGIYKYQLNKKSATEVEDNSEQVVIVFKGELDKTKIDNIKRLVKNIPGMYSFDLDPDTKTLKCTFNVNKISDEEIWQEITDKLKYDSIIPKSKGNLKIINYNINYSR